jgi:hypothetical protein
MGIEQLLPPFFIAWEFFRYLVRSKFRLLINSPIRWSFLLAIWWIVPIAWLGGEHVDIFIKESATVFSQFFILVLLWNTIHSSDDWRRLVRGLIVLAIYVTLASLIYLSGAWRGQLISTIGRVLPSNLIEDSAFFGSISVRIFGVPSFEIPLLSSRLYSFALGAGPLSILCLLLIPFVCWRMNYSRGIARFLFGVVLVGLILSLVFSISRTAYLASIIGIMLFVTLRLELFNKNNRMTSILLISLTLPLLMISGYLGFSEVQQAVQNVFVDFRYGSWIIRLNIYRESYKLFWEHPIAGWGQPIQIPGQSTVYSAGTHSSLLGILFQHGFIGFILYLGLWISIWRLVIRGIKEHPLLKDTRLFWIVCAVALLSFNIRELTATWWWDQLGAMTIWTIWGLVMVAPRIVQQQKVGAYPAQ